MRVGWVLRLEDKLQTVVQGVLRLTKSEAQQHCDSLKNNEILHSAEIASIYTEYATIGREVKTYNRPLESLMKDLADLNPVVLSQNSDQIRLEHDNVT